MPDAPDTFRTARLVASRVDHADLEDFQRYYADPVVMRTLSADGKPWPRSASADLMLRHLDHWREHGFGTWIFRDPGDGRFVGRGGLRRLDVRGGTEVELFYGVASDLWGRGIATEMARGVLDIAFRDVGLPEVVAFTLPTNHASRRVLEKCGFGRDGWFTHAGLQHELYRLARASWPSTRTV